MFFINYSMYNTFKTMRQEALLISPPSYMYMYLICIFETYYLIQYLYINRNRR